VADLQALRDYYYVVRGKVRVLADESKRGREI
jgi:CRP-like cAMP-binding protein